MDCSGECFTKAILPVASTNGTLTEDELFGLCRSHFNPFDDCTPLQKFPSSKSQLT